MNASYAPFAKTTACTVTGVIGWAVGLQSRDTGRAINVRFFWSREQAMRQYENLCSRYAVCI